jgi:orotidine-5'-phosphate decarboxylase
MALDVDTVDEALRIAPEMASQLGALKIGPRLAVQYGSSLIRELVKHAPVFVDNKYFDIPSTVLAATRMSFEAGASLVTVHAANGPSCLAELAKLERQISERRPVRVLAVTILTSFSEAGLPFGWRGQTISGLVQGLVEEIRDAGLTGIVCSPHEIPLVRRVHPQAYIITPGIRPPGSAQGDQARTMTAPEALAAGAKGIVVGRPLLEASDGTRLAALARILGESQVVRP